MPYKDVFWETKNTRVGQVQIKFKSEYGYNPDGWKTKVFGDFNMPTLKKASEIGNTTIKPETYEAYMNAFEEMVTREFVNMLQTCQTIVYGSLNSPLVEPYFSIKERIYPKG